jgi:hypothetical protein
MRRSDTARDSEEMTTRATGDLNRSRWYSSGKLRPTGEVLASAGADRDEVVPPGAERAILTPELFDPETETWRDLTDAERPRTYHNSVTAARRSRADRRPRHDLDALHPQSDAGARADGPNNGRDPSFEIFSPPHCTVATGRRSPRRRSRGATARSRRSAWAAVPRPRRTSRAWC